MESTNMLMSFVTVLRWMLNIRTHNAIWLRFCCITVLTAVSVCAHPPATTPPQLPLCMIGDSITWAGDGDYWRQYLVEQMPTLAFVGNHSAALGYSHAGEGGNSTGQVLQRMDAIPDCPFYHLLIGTNDRRSTNAVQQQALAKESAERILMIVRELLKKTGVQKVFLGSLLPCQTAAPCRDQRNIIVNAILRPQIDTLFPENKVVWVEYEHPIRAMRNWGPIIQLHPTKTGYRLLATILAQTLRDELNLGSTSVEPKPHAGAGVRVTNLWGDGKTLQPIIAGWYTLSFDVKRAEFGASITLSGEGRDSEHPVIFTFSIPDNSVGQRVTWNLMTGYAGYKYKTSVLTLTEEKCTLERILFEKKRPSGAASIYGTASYLDPASPIALGELVEPGEI